MRRPRFFCAAGDVEGNTVTLPEAEARHALRVLRLGPGDRITVLDGTGAEHEAILEEPAVPGSPAPAPGTPEAPVRARIVATRPRTTEPSLHLVLLQGLPKGDKLDLIVQKATELGVSRIVPVLAERSVSRPDLAQGQRKTARWQRIAHEAAKQAGRAVVPEVGPPQTLEAALRSLPAGARLIVPWEGERHRTLTEAAALLLSGEGRSEAPTGRAVAVLIGPEGGLSEAEIGQVEEHGGVTVTLGPRLLRTETAGLVTLACLLYATNNLE